jgi:hypothetical protein
MTNDKAGKALMRRIKMLFCFHEWEISQRDIVHHCVEGEKHSYIKCCKCGTIKKYEWII